MGFSKLMSGSLTFATGYELQLLLAPIIVGPKSFLFAPIPLSSYFLKSNPFDLSETTLFRGIMAS